MPWWRSKSQLPEEIEEADLPLNFGRYELRERIGQGGMGQVFRAWLLGPAGFRKEVALKLIRAKEPSEQARLEFLSEARVGAMLDHPNLVSTQDLGEHQGQLFIAMDLVRGIALDSLIRAQGPLPGAAVLDIAVQLCAGLAAAHGLIRDGSPLRLVHCDVKPGNVLISHTGLARLTDFGLAQALDTQVCRGPGIRGSLNYMPPEQIRGDQIDCRADIYALGLVISEMVTSHRFFDQTDRAALITAIQAVDGRIADPYVRTPLDTAIPGLSDVLDQCIRAEPSERFSSVVELGHALRALAPAANDERSLVEILGEAGIGDPESLDYSLRDSSRLSASRPLENGNLGPEPDRFVGRQEELSQLEKTLSEGRTLITIKGPGGSGKTRLSKRLGRRFKERFPGGVRFCDLSECHNLSSLLQSLGQTLGVPLSQGEPEELVMLLGQVLRGQGRALLILDNFEQLADHAPATLSWWQRLAPETVILVSSRVHLHLPDEVVLDLEPLAVSEGIELLIARAEGWTPAEDDFEALHEIIVRLDGSPLAIELAAARLRMLTPAGLLGRLDQRFKLLSRRGDGSRRQDTLRATIDWSWDLLEPWEQAALAQLSVFRGGFFLEAAEEILDLTAYPHAPWTMDVVGSLLDHSLLWSQKIQGQPRFRMYESIRAYAANQLNDVEELTGAQTRHSHYFAALGSLESLDALYVHGGLERMRWMITELENLLAGFEAAVTLKEPDLAQGCAVAAALVLQDIGPLQTGKELVERALAVPGLEERGALILLREMIWFLSLDGRVEEAIELGRSTLVRAQKLEDSIQESRLQSILAFLHRGPANAAIADVYYTNALRLARQVGDRALEGVILNNQGSHFRTLDQLDECHRLVEQALQIAREVGNSVSEGHARGNLAMFSSQLGRTQEARLHYEEAIRLFRRTGNRRLEGTATSGLAEVLRSQGLLDEAMETCRTALQIHRSLGNPVQECIAMGNLGDIHVDRDEFEEANLLLRDAIRIGDEVLPAAAGAFRGSLGLVLAIQGNFEEARSMLLRGETALRDGNTLELGKLLCKRARVEVLAGEQKEAKASVEEAQFLAERLEVGPEGNLVKAIEQVNKAIARLASD